MVRVHHLVPMVIVIVLAMASIHVPVSAQNLDAPQGPGLQGWWMTITAYKVSVAFWTGLEPHFAAFFTDGSRNCVNPHYLGPGGDPATCESSAGCIENWDWWGSNYNRLLLPKKKWLAEQPPWGDRWQGRNYQATCYFQ